LLCILFIMAALRSRCRR